MAEPIDPSVMIALKTLTYVGYIYFGLRYFRGDATGYIGLSVLLGITRSALGIVFGVVAFYVFTMLAASLHFQPPSGIAEKMVLTTICLLPGRFLIWVLIGRIVAGRLDQKVFLWILGGLAISLPFDLYLCFQDKFIGPFIFIG